MPMLDQIMGNRNKVSTVVDTAILYLITKGTLENFTKFSQLDSGATTCMILTDVVGIPTANK